MAPPPAPRHCSPGRAFATGSGPSILTYSRASASFSIRRTTNLVSELLSPFAQQVMDGLTCSPQKTLPCSWLYDDLGSALFEAITLLPEYGLTRADAGLLRGAAHEIVTLS